jgi:hypothetical protein
MQATKLKQMLELYAARTLFEPQMPELPSGFVATIEKLKEGQDALVVAK